MQFHMDFIPAQKELNASKRCFERMVSAKNYEEYEEAWCDFLNRLEKIFEKLQRACNPHKEKFNTLLSKENALRSSDPLLRYLNKPGTRIRTQFRMWLNEFQEAFILDLT